MIEEISTIIGIASLYVIEKLYSQYKKKREDPKKLDNAIERNAKIYPILWRILAKYPNCNRVYITQFHNGNKFYSGQSIQRTSISHEVTLEDTPEISKKYTDIPISETMHKVLLRLRTVGYHIELNNKEVIDSKLKTDMNILHIRSMCSVSLNNKEGDIIGILSLNFNRDINKENKDILIRELIILKPLLEHIINN